MMAIFVNSGSLFTSSHHGEYPCTIPRIPKIEPDEFMRLYRNSAVIVEGAANNSYFQYLSSREQLLENYGDREVTLSHSTTYSNLQRRVSFRYYIEELMRPVSINDESNSTFYFFGDYPRDEWDDLLKHYQRPPYFADGSMLSFGLGGDQSLCHFISMEQDGVRYYMVERDGLYNLMVFGLDLIPIDPLYNGFMKYILI